MSKSKGNSIDPLDLIEKYGTDATRMSLVFSAGQGNAIVLTDDKIIAQKKFANKLWNASKFVLMNIDETVLDIKEDNLDLQKIDIEIFSKLQKIIQETTENIDKYMFHEAAQGLYQFFWHDFCDTYIEESKAGLNSEDEKRQKTAKYVLYIVLETSLKMLHPFMPFITENIFEEIPKEESQKNDMLIISKWPSADQIINILKNKD